MKNRIKMLFYSYGSKVRIHCMRYLNLTSDTSAKQKDISGVTTVNDKGGNAPP